MKAEPPSVNCPNDRDEERFEASGSMRSAAFTYYARLHRVREYTERRLGDGISLKSAAKIAGLEEKYFSTFFHAKTGIRFKEWVTRVRIDRAMRMMRARNHSITHVALAVGFQDLGTFERAFKRCAGMTPREFKRLVRPS